MRLLSWQKKAVTDPSHQALLMMGGGVLVIGSEGHGRLALIERMAKAALCLAATSTGDACGACSSCNLTDHPDLHRLTAEPGKLISIDSVRQLAARLQQTAQQGGARVAIVDPASKMSMGATNALLKTLEEPGDRTLLILGSDAVSSVLPTIRSRCRLLEAPRATYSEAEQWLAMRGHDALTIERALQASFNEPLTAEALLEQGLLSSYDEFLTDVEQVGTGKLDPVSLGQRWQKTSLVQLLSWWMEQIHQQVKGDINALESLHRHQFYRSVVDAMRQAKSPSNLNAAMLLEQLAIQWFQCNRRIAKGANGSLTAHEQSVCGS